jgi:hypothetical protein
MWVLLPCHHQITCANIVSLENQSLEKAFKESLVSKRLSQNPAYTFSDELLTASDPNVSGSELTKGAVDELQRLKGKWKTIDTQRVRQFRELEAGRHFWPSPNAFGQL